MNGSVSPGGEEHDEGVGDGDEVEATEKIALRPVIGPTPEERSAHEVSHLPYRSWCAHCVAGRGRALSHPRAPGLLDPQGLMVVDMDYGFLRRRLEGASSASADAESRLTPVLVMRDRATNFPFYIMTETKGPNPFAVEEAAGFLRFLGYPRFALKSDNEAALIAVKAQVKKTLALENVGVTLEEVPVGDSQGNGGAEQAVGAMQGLSRTLVAALEHRLKKKIAGNHKLVPWLVRHASSLASIANRGRDGRTPWERLRNRVWRAQLPEFGEVVYFKHKPKDKLAARWASGIFLGVVLTSTQKIVSTAN